MMRVRLHMLTMDPFVAATTDTNPVQESWEAFDDPVLPGPVSRRVAILDFDGQGALKPGVPLLENKRSRFSEFDWGQRKFRNKRLANLAADRLGQRYNREALRSISVFTLVNRVLELFEEPDSLGRRINWAFPGEQLLVVPRAGEWANAFYDRATRSLQFFSFRPETRPEAWIHTADSPDIVAHEAAHAVVDGIAPDLYDSISPESLAIHEAVSDLTAVFLNLDFSRLRKILLEKSGDDLRTPTPIGLIAEEFGQALMESGGPGHLRSVYGCVPLDTVEPEPHALSEVLSSAIWDALATEFERRADPTVPGNGPPRGRSADDGEVAESVGKRLWFAAWVTRRVLFRALDYLPPGDCSFLDLGRAMVAADEAAYPDPTHAQWRKGLVRALLVRGIGRDEVDLQAMAPLAESPFGEIDLSDFVESDWCAYGFVERHRSVFCIPPDAPFDVRPRILTVKQHYTEEATRSVRELIVKVTWWGAEPNVALASVAADRRIRRGATLVVAIDEPGLPVRVRLANDPRLSANSEEAARGSERREAFLARLLVAGKLAVVDETEQEEVRRMGLVPVTASGGSLRIRELGAMLHMFETDHVQHRHRPATLAPKSEAAI